MNRVLVTGSRTWTDRKTIEDVLFHIKNQFGKFTLVSGACPTGADHIAEEIASEMGLEVERHPADWKRHGRGAGFVRNAEMVNLGADLCIAFILNESKGATMTADLAHKKGIPVWKRESTE